MAAPPSVLDVPCFAKATQDLKEKVDMEFERFIKATTTRGRGVNISVRKGGQMGFSVDAVKLFKIDQFKVVFLSYDSETKRIGVNFSNEVDHPDSIRISFQASSVGICAKSFYEFFKIPYQKTRLYRLKFNETEQIHVADLGEMI